MTLFDRFAAYRKSDSQREPEPARSNPFARRAPVQSARDMEVPARTAASDPVAPVIPVSETIDAAPRTQAPVPPVAQAESEMDGARVVVGLASDIPSGTIVSDTGGIIELPEDRRQNFVLIHTGANHITVLHSPDVYAKPVMFHVRKQVSESGYSATFVCAQKEVIKIAYESDRAAKTKVVDSTEIEQLIAKIIDDAYRQKASDIHIEARTGYADILFRVNGVRRFYDNISRESAEAFGKVLYSVYADASSKDVTWNPADVCDSSVDWVTGEGARLQLRFSSSPIFPNGNFQIVLRLLAMESSVIGLEALGYSQEQIDMIDLMSSGSNGVVLLCGPTNSGKSTTLQSAINRVFSARGKEIKIITVEDPVEYVIPGACQIQVARKRGIATNDDSVFTKYLRGSLRQDPDVVMVGEIRDSDSVMVTRDLVLAGRKVFATLHANSALWAFARLEEIGLPLKVMTMPSFIAGIVYQRLLPTLCPHCALNYEDARQKVPQDVLHRLQYVADMMADDIRFRGPGCPHCGHTGIAGRTVVAEIVVPDRTLLKYLSEGRSLEAEAYWRNGMFAGGVPSRGTRPVVTTLQHAIVKMRRGIVSPVDIEHQIGVLTSDMLSDEPMADLRGFGKK